MQRLRRSGGGRPVSLGWGCPDPPMEVEGNIVVSGERHVDVDD